MKYQKFYSDEKNLYKNMEPYGVQIFQRRWYVLARNPENDTLHTFALDRMSNIEVQDETFKRDPKFDLEKIYSGCYGIIVEDIPVESIRLSTG